MKTLKTKRRVCRRSKSGKVNHYLFYLAFKKVPENEVPEKMKTSMKSVSDLADLLASKI